MPRLIARPDKLDLDSPGRRDYWVALEHDHNWADWLIPLTVWVGPETRKGQGLSVTGANHGNEYEGPTILKHLIREIRTEDVRGRIIMIPVLSPSAFHAAQRYSAADGVNMNRAFLDGAGMHPAMSSITYRIVRFVREYIWPRVHVVIDLHSANRNYHFLHCSSFHPIADSTQGKIIEDTARWFGTPYVMTYQDQTPGLLPSEAERLGKITVGTELGFGESINPAGVAYGRHGVLAAAINHGLLKGEIKPHAHHADGSQKLIAIVDRECYVPAPFPGHFQPLFDVGHLVHAGQTVGYLHDFHRIDEAPYPITAKVDGILICQAWEARVPPGQHIAVVAKVVA